MALMVRIDGIDGASPVLAAGIFSRGVVLKACGAVVAFAVVFGWEWLVDFVCVSERGSYYGSMRRRWRLLRRLGEGGCCGAAF